MADVEETKSLLLKNGRNSITKKFKVLCVNNKDAMLVILWSVLISNFGIYSSILINPRLSSLQPSFPSTFVIITVSYILYPILGLLGEKWTRYKMLTIGTLLCGVSYVFLLFFSISVILDDYGIHIGNPILLVTSSFASLLFYLGIGLFEANIIQFGSDQLQFASSSDLSCFLRWFVWMAFFPTCFGTILE